MKTPTAKSLPASPQAVVANAQNSGSWILAATILGSSMAFIDGTVVNVAVPALQRDFHASVVDAQWVVESYGVLLSSLILVGGALGDMLGRRGIFLVGVGLFTIASAACGLAMDMTQLIVARSIQGIGAALLVPGSLAIISAAFDEETRGRAIGTWSGFTAITTAFGPVLGGWLIQHASWRWAFFLNVPLAVAVIAISLRHVAESYGPEVKRLDWLGALLATVGLAGIVTGFLEASRMRWQSPIVLGSLVGGFLSLAAFIAIETRAASPMVPLGLFRSRTFLGANIFTLFLYATLGIFVFLFPMDLIDLEGYSATAAGSAMLPMILLMFLLSRWSGGLVRRYGGKVPLIVGPLIVAVGFLLFALLLGKGGYWTTYFPAVLTFGMGMAITAAPLTTVVMNSVSERQAGTVSGINNAVARLAGVLAIAVLGSVMIKVFDANLDRRLTDLRLPADTIQRIRANEIELAALQPPGGLDANQTEAIGSAICGSFTSGFRVVLLCCAGLSIGSALLAMRFVATSSAKAN